MIPRKGFENNMNLFIKGDYALNKNDFMIVCFLALKSTYDKKKGKNYVKIKQKDIAEKFNCSVSLISHSIKRLEKARILEKSKDNYGQRIYLLSADFWYTGSKKDYYQEKKNSLKEKRLGLKKEII